MKMRGFLMLGLALVLAGASVFLARNWILTRVEPQSVQEPIVPQVPPWVLMHSAVSLIATPMASPS